jgi:hypothetical protein
VAEHHQQLTVCTIKTDQKHIQIPTHDSRQRGATVLLIAETNLLKIELDDFWRGELGYCAVPWRALSTSRAAEKTIPRFPWKEVDDPLAGHVDFGMIC